MDTDHSLLNSAKLMDKEALVKIFDRYSVPLYRYALRLCGDPLQADHVVGDVFAKLLEQFAAGKGPRDNLRSYLFESTYHRVIDRVPFDRTLDLPRSRARASSRNESHVSGLGRPDPVQADPAYPL